MDIGDFGYDSAPISFGSGTNTVVALDGSSDLGISWQVTRPYVSYWRVGDEERGIDLQIEVINIGDGYGIIAHQQGGYEHVKRAYEVFELMPDGLERRFQHVEGAGPHGDRMEPIDGGLMLTEEFFAPGYESKQETRFKWVAEGDGHKLEKLSY